ncbi:LamG domain-containing protein [Candidatus Poribacteria bacterium]|nr:LamG domain-containing protein [Candidatus Poribacteria bacterium]
MRRITWHLTAAVALTFGVTVGVHAQLAVHYDFESIANAQVLDMSGNGIDATVKGDVTSVAGGKFGKAGKFASKGFLDLNGPAIPAAKIPKDAITIAAWINVENTGDQHEIFNARATDGTFIFHPEYRSDNSWRWLVRDNATIFEVKSATGAQTGAWIHFAGVYSSKDAIGALYVNGVKVGEQQLDAAKPRPMQQDWGQGARVGMTVDGARAFTGLMDDFVIYAKALSEAEVNTLMKQGVAKPAAVSPGTSLATMWGTLRTAR